MTDLDYKKYSLENLEKWMSDALLSSEATPKEIYDVIRGVVHEEYHYFKHQTGRCYELLALLGGADNLQEQVKAHGELWDKEDIEAILAEREYYEGVGNILSCDKDDPSPECQKSWNDFWDEVDEKHSREYNLREAEYYNKRAELDAKWKPVSVPSKPLYVSEDGDVWIPDTDTKEDKVVKWQLPIEIDGASGEYYIQFPDDLMEAAGIKENDMVEWVDQGNGSYILRRV